MKGGKSHLKRKYAIEKVPRSKQKRKGEIMIFFSRNKKRQEKSAEKAQRGTTCIRRA
jgi:hypothetical protein